MDVVLLIGAAQKLACEESNHLAMVSKSAYGYYKKGLLQDNVHYSMQALNALGSEIAKNIVLYYNGNQKIALEESEDLTSAREYMKALIRLEDM